MVGVWLDAFVCILVPLDVVLAEVGAGLDFDDFEVDFARVGEVGD